MYFTIRFFQNWTNPTSTFSHSTRLLTVIGQRPVIVTHPLRPPITTATISNPTSTSPTSYLQHCSVPKQQTHQFLFNFLLLHPPCSRDPTDTPKRCNYPLSTLAWGCVAPLNPSSPESAQTRCDFEMIFWPPINVERHQTIPVPPPHLYLQFLS